MEHLLHTKSLQHKDNKGLQSFRKAVESIIIMPSASFDKQIDEMNKEIVLKKLCTEIIMGKTTKDAAMELNAEGGTSFEQLQNLIKKECDKRDKKYRSLEYKYNKLQELLETSQSQKTYKRGTPVGGASNKKKSLATNRRATQTQRGRSTSKRRTQTERPRGLSGRQGNVDDTSNDITNDKPGKSVQNRRSRSQQKKKPSATD